jgi:hypothetical protein
MTQKPESPAETPPNHLTTDSTVENSKHQATTPSFAQHDANAEHNEVNNEVNNEMNEVNEVSADADSTKTAMPPHGHRHDLSHLLFTTSKPGTEIKKQISYIAPGQTAKALMLIYLTFSVPIVLLAILVGFLRYGDMQLGSVFSAIFSALIVNAIVGFILLWIACQAYNWVASRFGGIEITLSDTPEDI